VSGRESHMRQARRLAFGIVAGQLGAAVLVAVAALVFAGPWAGFSALTGGVIGTVASLYMVVSLFRPATDADEPRTVLFRLYRAEFYKLLTTAGLFALVLIYTDVAFGPMLGGLGATLVVFWLVLGLRLT
jgi:F0F1-type ATP synthase assembly protein I